MGVLIITHYERILDYIPPDFVHILVKGQIVKSGGPSLSKEIEAGGYDPILKELGLLEGATAS
jgi:Fe-S cluster assembly ATP-binding protein